MKKILYIITGSELGGAQVNVLNLVNGFRSSHEIVVVAGDEGFLTEQLQDSNVRVMILPELKREIRLGRDMRAMRRFYDILKKEKPDLIHAHSSKAGLIARLVGFYAHIPVVFTSHGWLFADGASTGLRYFSLFLEWFLGFFSDHIVCVSRSDYRLALKKKIVNPKRLSVIYNGIDERVSDLAACTGNPPRFIMVARFAKQKDHKTLMDALSALLDLEWIMDFVGDGPLLPFYKEYAASLGISDRCRFLGSVPKADSLLPAYDGFILSTHYEGLPISIIEAMRAGLPVIATDVDGIPELIENNSSGFLFGLRNPRNLSDLLRILITSPDLRQRMGNKGRNLFLASFSLSSMLDSFSKLYIKVSTSA